MLRTALAFLVASTLTSPAWAQGEGRAGNEPPPQSASPFSEAAVDRELALARSWLEVSLVDYEAARFRNVRLVLVSPNRRNPREVGLAVCGLVNARNRMGGYNGFETFSYSSSFHEMFRGVIGGSADNVCGGANRLNATDYSDRLSADGAGEAAR